MPENLKKFKGLKNLNLKYSGKTIVCGGIIKVKIAHVKIILFPGNLNLANPYATNIHDVICNILVIKVNTAVNKKDIK